MEIVDCVLEVAACSDALIEDVFEADPFSVFRVYCPCFGVSIAASRPETCLTKQVLGIERRSAHGQCLRFRSWCGIEKKKTDFYVPVAKFSMVAFIRLKRLETY